MRPPPRWAALGLTLRPVRPEDQPFLRRLFGESRAEEMALSGWPADQVAAFLDSQFALQQHHFEHHYPGGDFQIVEAHGAPIGRLYLHDAEDTRLIVDIGLLSDWRGRGLGAALIKQVQIQTRRAGLARARLHVRQDNAAARRLYLRMGFRSLGPSGAHERMEWTPS